MVSDKRRGKGEGFRLELNFEVSVGKQVAEPWTTTTPGPNVVKPDKSPYDPGK